MFLWLIIQLQMIIELADIILSLTHRKCRSKPNIWILPPLLLKPENKYGRSELYRDQIFSQTIYLYNKKFDWLFIADPIWLVWHTYISHSLTHSSIDPSITYPDAPTKRFFFLQKNNSKILNDTTLTIKNIPSHLRRKVGHDAITTRFLNISASLCNNHTNNFIITISFLQFLLRSTKLARPKTLQSQFSVGPFADSVCVVSSWASQKMLSLCNSPSTDM